MHLFRESRVVREVLAAAQLDELFYLLILRSAMGTLESFRSSDSKATKELAACIEAVARLSGRAASSAGRLAVMGRKKCGLVALGLSCTKMCFGDAGIDWSKPLSSRWLLLSEVETLVWSGF